MSFAIGALVFVSGCGGSGDYFGSASGEISKADAQNMLSELKGTAPTSLEGGSAPVSSPTAMRVSMAALPRPASEGSFEACTTFTPAKGSEVDADNDGIPLTKSMTFACSDISFGDGKASENGSYTITDKDDTKADGGYKYEFDFTGKWGTDTNSEGGTSKGSSEMTKTDATYAFTHDWKSEWSGTYQGKSWSYTGGASGTLKFVGTDAANPTKAGSAEFSFYYGGHYGNTTDGLKEVVFKVSSENLTYDATTCAGTFYKSGSITFEDGKGNKIKLAYDNCTLTSTYNGDPFATN